jgi:hypothetical protein
LLRIVKEDVQSEIKTCLDVVNYSVSLGKEICLFDLITAHETPINTFTTRIDPLLTVVSLSLVVNTVVLNTHFGQFCGITYVHSQHATFNL